MKFNLSTDTELSIQLLEKILQKDKGDMARLIKLENYYLGKHQILQRIMADSTKPNNKVVNPFATYITDTLSGYICGEPITYSSLDEEALEDLNLTLVYNDGASEDMAIARDMSIYGVAYELLYIDEENITRFAKVSPKDIIIIYDDTIEQNILYAIRKIPVYDILTDRKSYKIEVYSSTDIKYYSADENLLGVVFVDEKPHFFNDVPIIEFKNNEREVGDYETIIPLIDAYDKLESDSLNDYDYFVDAYLLLSGVTADAEDIQKMKENRVLLLDSDSKAEWLIKNANDTVVENVKNRIHGDIHKFAKVPDLSDENFASNASGIAIKFKLYGTETLCATKERYLQKGLQRRIELIFNIANLKGGNFDWRAIEINFTRNMPTNDSEIADMVQKLSGIVSTETLLAQLPFINDVSAEVQRLEEEKEQNPFYNLELETEENLNQQEE